MASRCPFLVYLFFTTVIVLSATNPSVAQPAVVLDGDGDEVRIGSRYQISAEGIGFFGGLTRLQPANKTACAKPVGPGKETDPGLPTLFTPGIPDEASTGVLGIRVRSEIEFRLITPAICAAPGVWTTQTNTSGADGELFEAIVAGQELDTEATQAWFEVWPTKTARVYKLIYCPCLRCKIACFQKIGKHVVDGKTVLGIGGSPFTFRFIKNRPREAADNLPLAAV